MLHNDITRIYFQKSNFHHKSQKFLASLYLPNRSIKLDQSFTQIIPLYLIIC